MSNGLKLGTGVATQATTTKEELASREGATSRPHAEGVLPKPLESAAEVEIRLDKTQPVSGDNAVAGQTPEKTFLDPPTPAEERKNTLESDAKSPSEAPKPVSVDDGVVRYSSHPILKFKVGRFRFENGLLELTEEKDIEEFKKTLDDLPRSEKIRIKELNLSAAEAQVRAVLKDGPRASKGTGSDTGDRAPSNQVGKGVLGGDSHGE